MCAKIGALTSTIAGGVFTNTFSDRVSVSAITKTATDDRGELVATKFAKCLEQGFAAASPESKLFAENGKSISNAFSQAFSPKHFEKLADEDPLKAFEYLINAGEAAVDKGLTSELKSELSKKETCENIIKTLAVPPEAFKELEESEEELLEYERALVLIDDGGVTLAEQKSIKKPEKTRQETGLVPWKKDSDKEIMTISSDFVLGRLFIDKRMTHI